MKDTREQLEARYAESCRKMEELMAQLPRMEQKNATWKRLLQVKELLEAETDWKCLTGERQFMKEQERRYQEAGKSGMSAYIQAQMGYRDGLLKEAERKYQSLLEESGFADGEAAREWLGLCKEEEGALQKELEAFQKEYNRVLAECQQLDCELYGENE